MFSVVVFFLIYLCVVCAFGVCKCKCADDYDDDACLCFGL